MNYITQVLTEPMNIISKILRSEKVAQNWIYLNSALIFKRGIK